MEKGSRNPAIHSDSSNRAAVTDGVWNKLVAQRMAFLLMSFLDVKLASKMDERHLLHLGDLEGFSITSCICNPCDPQTLSFKGGEEGFALVSTSVFPAASMLALITDLLRALWS